jgi:hypothetical protein
MVAPGSPAADTELPHSGVVEVFAVVEVSAAVGGAVVGAGRISG